MPAPSTLPAASTRQGGLVVWYSPEEPIRRNLVRQHERVGKVVAGTSRRIRERGHEEVWLRRAFYRGRRCARIGIERFGPIGVVDLADRIGRDYTTVSRQVAKLDELGLVRRQAGVGDGRVREAVVTPQGHSRPGRSSSKSGHVRCTLKAEVNSGHLMIPLPAIVG
jgi:MarR family